MCPGGFTSFVGLGAQLIGCIPSCYPLLPIFPIGYWDKFRYPTYLFGVSGAKSCGWARLLRFLTCGFIWSSSSAFVLSYKYLLSRYVATRPACDGPTLWFAARADAYVFSSWLCMFRPFLPVMSLEGLSTLDFNALVCLFVWRISDAEFYRPFLRKKSFWFSEKLASWTDETSGPASS
jgi:hypothetical protein